MAAVHIEGVSKRYGDKVVFSDLSITIPDGECFTLLGPSGCGKTVLMRLIAGFETPESGRISIGDTIVTDTVRNVSVPPDRRSLGMVFQDYAVWPHMSVFENVAYPLKLAGLQDSEQKSRAMSAIEQVGLMGLEARLPSQLSGGQQQRVALARALVSEPKLLLLDEPLNNLDANLREEMRFEIKALQKKLGVTILYITHDQEIALGIADQIAVMDESGRIRQVDSPQGIYENAADDFVFRFLGVANFLPVRRHSHDLWLGGSNIPWRGEQPTSSGDAWTIGFRPGDVVFTQGDEGMPAKIKRVSFLGATVDYLVEIAGRLIRISQPSHEGLACGRLRQEGETCRVNFLAVHWFLEEVLGRKEKEILL